MSNTRPGGRRDPLAVGFLIVVVLLFAAGVVLVLRAATGIAPGQERDAPASTASGGRFAELLAWLRREAATLNKPPRLPKEEEPAVVTAPRGPGIAFPRAAAPDPARVLPLPGGQWSYLVGFSPEYRPAGELVYESRVDQGAGGPRLRMYWQPAGGKAMTWDFGVFAAYHPSHANIRFPGFFMHAAYFPASLDPGAKLSWSFPWSGGPPGGRRRFEASLAGWESMSVPAGRFTAMRIDAVLSYVDGARIHARVRNILWYAPEVRQVVVRVVWLGRALDEASSELLAEFASIRLI